MPAGTAYVEISQGQHHSVALRSDGQVVTWGSDPNVPCVAPILPGNYRYTHVAAGWGATIATSEPVAVPLLACSQPGGTATGLMVNNASLSSGHEYFNLWSVNLCAGGPGTGPWGGLCFNYVPDLLNELQVPVASDPFHFVAASPA